VLSKVSIVLYSVNNTLYCYHLIVFIWCEAWFSYTCKVTVLDYFMCMLIVVHISLYGMCIICGCNVRVGD